MVLVRPAKELLIGLILAFGMQLAAAIPAIQAAPAGVSSEYQVKAVFLFNFAQFVQWPQQSFDNSTAPFVIGILGSDPFGPALEGAIHGETIDGRSFVIERYDSVTEVRHCQILFISRSEAAHIEQIGAALAGRSILTVSDTEGSAQRGVMIRFLSESNRIRLRIDADAAKAAGLMISSKLLRPAELVKS